VTKPVVKKEQKQSNSTNETKKSNLVKKEDPVKVNTTNSAQVDNKGPSQIET
jgi:hypothetical protein